MSFSCYVCSKNLISSDEIVSVQCGHTFHAKCLLIHNKEIPKCPQCLTEAKTTFKLNLNFETNDENRDIQLMHLRTEIDYLKKTNYQLQQDVETNKRDYRAAEEHFRKSDEKSKSKIKELKEQITSMQVQCANNDKRMKEIMSKSKLFELKNVDYSKEVATQAVAIQQVKEKNELMALELSREIHKSTELIVEKLKLESILKHFQIEQQHSFKLKDNETSKTNSKNETAEKAKSEFDLNLNTSNTARENTEHSKSFDQHIVIKHIEEKITNEKEATDYVLRLSRLLNFILNENDILKITIRPETRAQKITLILQLKSSSVRNLFLSKIRYLSKQKETCSLYICGLDSERTFLLFEKAKALKAFGFKIVYYENNEVFAKRDSNSLPIKIIDENHINTIKDRIKVFSTV